MAVESNYGRIVEVLVRSFTPVNESLNRDYPGYTTSVSSNDAESEGWKVWKTLLQEHKDATQKAAIWNKIKHEPKENFTFTCVITGLRTNFNSPRALYLNCTKSINISGIWLAIYGGHGLEVIKMTQTGYFIHARKIHGNQNTC